VACPHAGFELRVVRILFKKGSDFFQKIPPIYNFRVLKRYCLVIAEFILHTTYCCAELEIGKKNDFELIFEIQKQFLPAQMEVQFAEVEPRRCRGKVTIAQNPNSENWRYLLGKILMLIFNYRPVCFLLNNNWRISP
jgi:hypothetical protein